MGTAATASARSTSRDDGVRKIYETLFGVKGSQVDSTAALFKDGKPPVTLPKISPATRPKGSTK